MAEVTRKDAEEELRRRGILTGGTRSVLAQPEETTSLQEVQRFTESFGLLCGHPRRFLYSFS